MQSAKRRNNEMKEEMRNPGNESLQKINLRKITENGSSRNEAWQWQCGEKQLSAEKYLSNVVMAIRENNEKRRS